MIAAIAAIASKFLLRFRGKHIFNPGGNGFGLLSLPHLHYPRERNEELIMVSGWRVGSIFGIPVFIDPSWFLVLLLIAVPMGGEWSVRYPQWGPGLAYLAALGTVMLFFLSVLLHELGHSLVALAQGIKVSSITLFMFGGIASIDQESKTPGQAFQVAIAGPSVSLGLSFLFTFLTTVVPQETPLHIVVSYLAWTNLVLAIFNLLPGLPLDGGQILKAGVWKLTGSRFTGVRWAAKAGNLVGWTLVALGVLVVLRTGSFSGLWVALVGWFIIQNANSYDRITELQEALLDLKAGDAMTREFRVVDAHMSLRRFADDYLLRASRPEVFFAASEGRYRGLVADDDLNSVERSEWETEPLFRIIHPLSTIPTVEEATPLVKVIQQMETEQLRRMTVLSPASAVAGVIDRGDIVRALAHKLNMTVSDAVIKQIKEEGAYPMGFQLGAIAQSAIEATVQSR
jgi:Zn-dependent protease